MRILLIVRSLYNIYCIETLIGIVKLGM